jgi:hypothetical protein
MRAGLGWLSAAALVLALAAGCSEKPPAPAPAVQESDQPQATAPTAAPAREPAKPNTVPVQNQAAAHKALAKPVAVETPKPAPKPGELPPIGQGRAFFGIPVGEAHKIVLVCDRSGSMTDYFDYAKLEMKRLILGLDETDLFDVLFYTSGPVVELPSRALVPATEKNKRAAYDFFDSIVATGETDLSTVLPRMFELKPEVVFILCDGQPDRKVIDQASRLNAGGKVKVHTIAFINNIGEAVLKQIAEQNGGTYRFVSDADLEKSRKP